MVGARLGARTAQTMEPRFTEDIIEKVCGGVGVQLNGRVETPRNGKRFWTSPVRFGALGTADIDEPEAFTKGRKKRWDGTGTDAKQKEENTRDSGDGIRGA